MDEIEDRTICFCHNVSLIRLTEAIKGGANTLEKVQAETCASTGCSGCQWEVEEILAGLVTETLANSGEKR